MPADAAQRKEDLRLGLRACDQLLREVRRRDVAAAGWTIEELELLRTDLAAQLVAAEIGIHPRYVKPARG